MPEICRFDPGGCGFPPPRVPLLPLPRWREPGDGLDRVPAAVLDPSGMRHFARGRYALRAACRLAGLGPGGLLLAPSYHCRTILDPALALGAGVALYRVHEDLRPDLASIDALLEQAAGRARALLVPHYFGIEQPRTVLDELASLARRHGLLLIEDCAHAWMVAQRRVSDGVPPGRVVVASPYKYFACPDGGMLWTAPGQLPAQGRGRGVLDELRAARDMRPHRAGPMPEPVAGPDNGRRGAVHQESDEHPSHYYDAALEGRGSLLVSRWLIRRAQPQAIARQRRARYRQWLDAAPSLSRARPLAPELSENCSPYMFPLLISHPDPDFFRLKQAGLPIWRWDDMAVSDCAVARRYATSLLHLPCHQGLTDAQMDWMLALARKVLG